MRGGNIAFHATNTPLESNHSQSVVHFREPASCLEQLILPYSWSNQPLNISWVIVRSFSRYYI